MNEPYLPTADIHLIQRNGIGVCNFDDVTLVYRLNNLYFIGWMVNGVFYGDKCEFDENKNLKDPNVKSALPHMRNSESLAFEFRYDHLPMKTIQLNFVKKLLKSKKLADRKRGIASIIVMTSESWRFHPIDKACRKSNFKNTLSLEESILEYVDVLSERAEKALEYCGYTLRDLLNDWGKLSNKKTIVKKGTKIEFTENDIALIIKWKTPRK